MFENHKTQDFFWGALIGGAIGTLATMLFTTQKGHQIRKKIADKYNDLEEGIRDKAQELEESAEQHLKRNVGKNKKDE